VVLPALPSRRRCAHRTDAGEILRDQPDRGEPLQSHPERRAVAAQGLLHAGGGAELPELAQGHVWRGVLPRGAARLPAAPGVQCARLSEPRLFPAGAPHAGGRPGALCHLLRGILRRLGLLAQLDRAERGPVFFAHAHGPGLCGQAGHPGGTGEGAGLADAAAGAPGGHRAGRAGAFPRKTPRPAARPVHRFSGDGRATARTTISTCCPHWCDMPTAARR
jgi:hypothetical protein